MNPGSDRRARPKMDEDLRDLRRDADDRRRSRCSRSPTTAASSGARTRRCLGVGKCVTEPGGVMCPSYRATGEEMHSTRGRARLLFEMANGEVIKGGWRLRRGRRGARPVPVLQGLQDATAPSASTWRRTRPSSWRSATRARCARRRTTRWARCRVGCRSSAGCPRASSTSSTPWPAARSGRWPRGRAGSRRSARSRRSRAPDTRTGVGPRAGARLGARVRAGLPGPVRRRLRGVRRATPVHQDVSTVAPLPLGPGSRGRILLWPDTFTNHFDPAIAVDAVAVLERLGYTVELPPRDVCCGLTWTSTGQVDAAAPRPAPQPAHDRAVAGDGRARSSGWNPRCTAALRADGAGAAARRAAGRRAVQRRADVRRGARGEHVDELAAAATGAVAEGAGAGPLPPARRARHRRRPRGDGRLGVDAEVLDSGCCGLAGNFGFEKGHYDVSMAVRRARAAARGACRGRRRRGPRRRLLLPHAAAPGGDARAGAPCPAGGPRPRPELGDVTHRVCTSHMLQRV